jgi:hypothetical protein
MPRCKVASGAFPPQRAPDGSTRLDDVITSVKFVAMVGDYAWPAGFAEVIYIRSLFAP